MLTVFIGLFFSLNFKQSFSHFNSQKLINSAKYGTLNMHAGPLPFYRGGSPLNWQIINGEKKIGISIIKMSKGIDTGPVLDEKFFVLKKNDDIQNVHNKANSLFPKMMFNSIKKIIKPNFFFLKKNAKKISYFKQRKYEDGLINWKKLKNYEVFNFIRAITKPYPGAFTMNSKRQKIFIYKCNLANFENKNFKPGQVLAKRNNFYIKTKQKFIKLIDYKGKIKNGELLLSRI